MLVVGGAAAGLFNIYRLFEVAMRTGRMWQALPGLAVMGRISMHYDRNAAGSYFAMLLPLAAGICMASSGRRRQTNIAIAIVVAFAAWLTGSRVALAAVAASGLVMAAIVWRRVASQSRGARRRWRGRRGHGRRDARVSERTQPQRRQFRPRAHRARDRRRPHDRSASAGGRGPRAVLRVVD
jgi:hypothetical protein